MTETPQRFVIEPLDRNRHDRTAFSCGVQRVDNFLTRTAAKQIDSDMARVFVIIDGAPILGEGIRSADRSESAKILGFYALNAHEIAYQLLPQAYAKQRPGHGAVPAGFISMIGVDSAVQGQGLGERLLMDALARIVRTAENIGLSVIRLDVFDDGDATAMRRRKALYEAFGFHPLPSDEWKLFMAVETARKIIHTD
jgi:ribosomal protein S18 acetylase RimI-like enzyme